MPNDGDLVVKRCGCGRSYTQAEWDKRKRFWGLRHKGLRMDLEWIDCDGCHSMISIDVSPSRRAA